MFFFFCVLFDYCMGIWPLTLVVQLKRILMLVALLTQSGIFRSPKILKTLLPLTTLTAM